MAVAAGITVSIPLDNKQHIEADLRVPDGATGLVLFAHGSGSSRFSARNQAVAEALVQRGFATLLIDLLTRREEDLDSLSGAHRFDIPLLAERVAAATAWSRTRDQLRDLPVGYFGASTGAGAALVAAASAPDDVRAVVSRGGRPDLAGDALSRVKAPTLLIVGGNDEPVVAMNESAMRWMTAPVELRIVPGATHLFEEAGTLEQVEQLAAEWFGRYLLAQTFVIVTSK
jgi:putative phosphoribosyl transferase